MVESQNFLVFWQWLRRWALAAVAMAVFLMGARMMAFLYYGQVSPLLHTNPGDLAKAFVTGFRFDFVTICYGLALPVLSFMAWLFFPHPWSARLLTYFERIYFVVWIVLYVAVTLGDLGYYSYFQDHINVLIFGFFEDDTMALIRTFQKNYPFFSILAAAFGATAGLVWLARKVFKPENYLSGAGQPRPWSLVVAYIAFIPLVGLGARGSVGLFPLHEIDAAISPDPFINYLAYSGLHGLSRAIKIRGENNNVWNANGLYYGYLRWQDAAADLYNRPVDQLPADPIELLKQVTPANPWAAKTRPHVVVLLMESWGGYWLKYQSPEFNVLGELEPHFRNDNVLLNFLPSMTATIGSLSALMINSPHRPEGSFLTESRYMQVPFRFAPARVFKKSGYKTRFLYGGGIGWRTVDRFAKIQGFDSIEGDFAIESRYGKIEKHDWGIYDEHLFQYIEDTLKEATEPQFIFAVTTTNHPPYQVPTGYQPLPLNTPPDLENELTSDRDLCAQRFRVYQYSNRQLGKLMDRIKGSPLGEKTILAATGDHGFLLKNFAESELLQKWQTPLYLYIPPEAHQHLDRQTFGGHIDIFPTLFALSLSEKTHYSFGVNLLDAKIPHQTYHFSRLALSPAGAVISEREPIYLDWKQPYTELIRTTTPSPELQKLGKQDRALMGLLDYFYEFELQYAKTHSDESRNQ